jgi:hypothetical protein
VITSDDRNIPIGPIHFLKKKIKKQLIISKRGVKKKFIVKYTKVVKKFYLR